MRSFVHRLQTWMARRDRPVSGAIVLLVALVLVHLGLPAGCCWANPVPAGGNAACAGDAAAGSGCNSGGSIVVPDFFRGYANQSVGVSLPAGPFAGTTHPAATSLQPAVYPARPPWPVAGVDYAVGMPAALMPQDASRRGSRLKDPAAIARDPLVNPQRAGENCRFYASNDEFPGGTPAGTTRIPWPATNGGPSIVCNRDRGSQAALVFDGYDFGWNSRTGASCTQLIIKDNPWGRAAAQTSPDTAQIVIRNSLFVNGPNCNIFGGIGHGQGTAPAGPMSPNLTNFVRLVGGATPNSLAFYHNTVFGCGGDAKAGALETALCEANFNATDYAAGAIAGFVRDARRGVAPMDNPVLIFDQGGTLWVQYNAFVHIDGRVIKDTVWRERSEYFDHNYIEGLVYFRSLWARIASVACIENCDQPDVAHPATERLTTETPHGVPPGGWASMGFAGPAGGWSGTYSMQAIDATHLVFHATANPGDLTAAADSKAAITETGEHAEFVEWGYLRENSAEYQGTIVGNTLRVDRIDRGSLQIGDYVTANGGTAAQFTGTIAGRVLHVVAPGSGALAVGQALTGQGIAPATVIVAHQGADWLLNQPAPAPIDAAAMTTQLAIPGGTRIVAGSGAQWRLSTALAEPVSGAFASPAHVGFHDTVYTRYNTILWTRSQAPVGDTSFYWSCGLGNQGVPLCVFDGSIDHNVVVTNLIDSGSLLSTSVALAHLNYSSFGKIAITDNWVDPTGSYRCLVNQQSEAIDALTIGNNVNLLKPSDPYVNVLNTIAIVPYTPGTAPRTQAQSGAQYDPATGLVTLTTSMALPVQRGDTFEIGNSVISQGVNYLYGRHTVESVDGRTVTFRTKPGYPGVLASVSPQVVLIDRAGQRMNCFGHN